MRFCRGHTEMCINNPAAAAVVMLGRQTAHVGRAEAILRGGEANHRANQRQRGLWRRRQVQHESDADGSRHWKLGEDQETPLLKEAVSSAWKTLI